MDTERRRSTCYCHVITETLQGFDGPLAGTFLLCGALVRVALLLIRGPLPEPRIHAHQHLLPHCHRGTRAPKARCEAPEGAPQQCRGLARGPRPWHHETPHVAMPCAGAPLTTLARTGVVAWA